LNRNPEGLRLLSTGELSNVREEEKTAQSTPRSDDIAKVEKEKFMTDIAKENWKSGGPYEQYAGRWSRRVAQKFLEWLNIAPGQIWADVGCGTGALVDCTLANCMPRSVLAVDRSEGFVAEAQNRIGDRRVRFEIGDATSLPWPSASSDVTVSGLVLNFVSNAGQMTREMARVTRPGGVVAAYVWDYVDGMEMMRHFWDVAAQVSPNDSKLDQAERFPLCQPEPLQTLFRAAGLGSISVRAISVPTVFRDFDDYWKPFLGKQGAAPTYLASLNQESTQRIRDTLRARLVTAADGSIAMSAKAWAIQGIV
jgi:ubiquinone/menaquinone biosynthesis C-methylase UbiE